MRVTNSMAYRQSLGNITRSYARLAKAQNIAGSQQAIFKPSDNPQGTAKAIRNRSVLNTIDQHLRNVDDAHEWMDTADLTLSQVSDVLVRLKDLVQEAVNGTRSASDRQAASAEVSELIGELTQLADTKIDGRYLFSGNSADSQPFQVEVASGTINIGVSRDEIFSWTSTVTRNNITVSGDKIQLNNSLLNKPVLITVGDTIYHHPDTPGDPTLIYNVDSATGEITLPETRTETTATVTYDMDVLQLAKEIQKGLTDTGYVTRNIDSDSDGSIQIPPQPTDGPFKIIDSAGAVVTGYEMKYKVDEDGNQWSVVSGLPADSTFTITYSDPSQVDDVLGFLKDTMGLADLAAQHVTSIRTTLGSRSSRLESVQERLESRRLNVVDTISNIEDADFAEAATKLAEMEIQYQSALAAAAKSSRMSLLDYLK